MRIEHVAIWTDDLERLKRFYAGYFGATAGAHYVNAAKGFESCFLSLGEGARIELMRTTTVPLARPGRGMQPFGLTHLALSVGTDAQVDALTRRLRGDGLPVIDGPRRTGDGYYEAVVLDPDGNRVEICAERKAP